MYCSLRFFIDKTPNLLEAHNILCVFKLISDELGIPYDYILHTLFDPEIDRTVVNKKYIYDTSGKEHFKSSEITPLVSGKHGDLSAPFITATCNGQSSILYSKARTEIQFPVYSVPMIIRVDYEQKYAKKLDFHTFSRLIINLCGMEFHVNNAFFHIYVHKNEAVTLDGGQIDSIISVDGRRNLKKSILHNKNGCVNHLMDVFCANYVPCRLLCNENWNAIANIIGENNIARIDDGIAFALPNMEDLSPKYRIMNRAMLKKLHEILCSV